MNRPADIPPVPLILCASDFHFGCNVWSPLRLFGKRLIGQANYHLRRKRKLNYTAASAFRMLLEDQRPEALLALGDFTNIAMPEEFRTARAFLDSLAETGTKIYALPGNHDVYTASVLRQRETDRWLGPYLPPDGVPSRARIPGVASVQFFPTVSPNLLSSRGAVPPEGWQALESLTAQTGGDSILIASHYPLLDRTAAYRQKWSHTLRQSEKVLDILRRCPHPLTFIAGHVHRFSLTRDPVKPDLIHITVPAAFYSDPETQGA
ncbi:MAG TPA: metallophosphoesterase, partial [Candidatus Hydrogenedentes bacterium]|nr:metallophosphoesterase [Candidatus Hydrogenedentota bacterium]